MVERECSLESIVLTVGGPLRVGRGMALALNSREGTSRALGLPERKRVAPYGARMMQSIANVRGRGGFTLVLDLLDHSGVAHRTASSPVNNGRADSSRGHIGHGTVLQADLGGFEDRSHWWRVFFCASCPVMV